MIHLLMGHGTNINLVDTHGYGALEYALRTGNHSVISAVLQYGASLKAYRGHWQDALNRYFTAPKSDAPQTAG